MAGETPRLVNAALAPPPGGHYSHAAVAGGLVFLAGHLPLPEGGGHDPHADFATQARRVLAGLAASLAAAGSRPDLLVKVNVYVADIEDWPEFDAIYAEFVGNHRPARCVVPVPKLHYGYRIEIEAVAMTGGTP